MSIKIILSLSMLMLTSGYGESLSETVQKIISQNPQIEEAKLNLEATKDDFEVAKARCKPTLDIRAEKGRERTNSPANERELKIYNEEQVSIVGKWNLFDGLETTYKILEKSESVVLAENQLNVKKNKLALSATQVYLDVLRKKELLKIAESNCNLHNTTLRKVKDRVSGGAGYTSDVKQTKARVKLAEINKLIAKKNYEQSKINYQRLLLSVPEVESMITPIISYEEDLKIPKSLDADKLKNIYNKNFQIKIEESKNNIAMYLLKQQDSKNFPTIDLEVSKNYNNNIYGIRGRDDSSKIALVVNYNIYNGGADKASQKAASNRQKMALESKKDTNLTIEESLRIAILQYNISKEKSTLLKKQIADLNQTKELYDKEYQNSKRTTIDVLNVKQELNYAKSQRVNAIYDKLLAYYQFKSITGELLNEYNINVSNENNKDSDNCKISELLIKALNHESN